MAYGENSLKHVLPIMRQQRAFTFQIGLARAVACRVPISPLALTCSLKCRDAFPQVSRGATEAWLRHNGMIGAAAHRPTMTLRSR